MAEKKCTGDKDSRDVIQYLEDNGYYKFLDLIRAAGLEDELKTAGPFTVFAPTDAAFTSMPSDLYRHLTEDKQFRDNLIKTHILRDVVIMPDVVNDNTVTSLSGVTLRFNKYSPTLYTVDGISMTNPDHVVRNGVVHGINHVIIKKNVTSGEYFATHDSNFRDLFASIIVRGLFHRLSGDAPFTILAPTDKAFEEFRAKLSHIVNNSTLFEDLLKYHIIPRTYYTIGMTHQLKLHTLLQGSDITVTRDSSGLKVNGVPLKTTDISTLNGVVHVIDKVLVPPGLVK
ncbi:transforming growth factor-beta-induced protein ig-h3-like [Gigantopelta aegis]|uniref:transforming growth factor-beta-induced protein ig-h3-like n=1 Tax=Gigantopelta aegis TaxID=1735272 RepID=UPI001B88C3E2|nr:transforming growth factor-beta-induced protein ig-h3-like [Gigantopelta aegis]